MSDLIVQMAERAARNPDDLRGYLTKLAEDLDVPSVDEMVPLVRGFYAVPGNEAGGSLHVALDDGNLSDESVLFCWNHAREHDDPLGEAMAKALDRMSEEDREKLYERMGNPPVGSSAYDDEQYDHARECPFNEQATAQADARLVRHLSVHLTEANGPPDRTLAVSDDRDVAAIRLGLRTLEKLQAKVNDGEWLLRIEAPEARALIGLFEQMVAEVTDLRQVVDGAG